MSNLQKMKRGMNEFDFSTDSFKNFFKFFLRILWRDSYCILKRSTTSFFLRTMSSISAPARQTAGVRLDFVESLLNPMAVGAIRRRSLHASKSTVFNNSGRKNGRFLNQSCEFEKTLS